jgi:hypothetical protein
MSGFDPKSIGPWAWGREDADVTAAEATPVEVVIREVGEAVIPVGAAAEGIQEEEAAIRVVEDSSPKVVIRARRKGRRRQMTLLSSTRWWTSWEPSFQ